MVGQVAGALHRANDRIAELVDDDPTLSGTSTTATMALFDGERLTFGHVGDSRAYLFRDGEIRQVTKDHTFVQSLIDEGLVESAAISPEGPGNAFLFGLRPTNAIINCPVIAQPDRSS